VREAVVRLGEDRLVDLSPRRGARVAQVSVADYLEVNQLRSLLEPAAARAAADRSPDDEIEPMRLSLVDLSSDDAIDVRRLTDADQAVHGFVARHCGNERMHRWMEQLNDMMSLTRATDLRLQGGDMVESLLAIVDALARHDGEAAERSMRDHVDGFTRRLPNLLRTI
jgi:DNA-binding GntR family transcriptional regulator